MTRVCACFPAADAMRPGAQSKTPGAGSQGSSPSLILTGTQGMPGLWELLAGVCWPPENAWADTAECGRAPADF